MKKCFLGLVFFFVTINLISQTYYVEGTAFLQKGEFSKADSLFTLSLQVIPNKDAFYNRAIARMYMKDMKGFCLDLKSASLFDDIEATDLHNSECLTIDTVLYSDSFEIVTSNWLYKEIKKKEKYYDLIEGYFYSDKNKLIAEYKIRDNYKWFERLPNEPKFIGGEKKLWKFINSNLKYPKSEMDAYSKYAGDHATVYVQFDITESGKVQNVQVAEFKKDHTMKYISRNFTEEALRVIKLLPEFEIPTFMGEPTVYRYITPIKFEFPK